MNTAERIKLNFPIEHDGVPIADIALRRPTVGDHLAAQKSAALWTLPHLGLGAAHSLPSSLGTGAR